MTASALLDEILIRARRGLGQTSLDRPAVKPRAERLWKGLSSTGSAFVKRIPGGGTQHPKQLAGQLAYVNGKAKGTFGYATGVTFGEDIDKGELAGMIEAWSQDWKGRPRNGHTSHMVLSFPDDVSPGAAHAIAQEWCAEMFEDEVHADDRWEYVAALHTDTQHPHVHVILNNRGAGGTWFALSAEGLFTPQMLRDRMTDLAEEFGVRLESLSRVDRGIYADPIRSDDLWAEREGRMAASGEVQRRISEDGRRADMVETARLYAILSDFALTIGAPIIARQAHLSASLLFAGQQTTKGEQMYIELDVGADRSDLRKTLIAWAKENRERIDALPDAEQTEIMSKFDAALEIIETDIAPDLNEETIWAGFSEVPSAWLVHDAGALEARAALYVDEDRQDLLHQFVGENLLDRYLVTGQVPAKFEAVLPAVADAYAEMYSHDLSAIPREMKTYVERAAAMGLDGNVWQERLISSTDDPTETARMERQDIARIVAAKGISVFEHNETREKAILHGIRKEVARLRAEGHSRAYISERSFEIEEAAEQRVLAAEQKGERLLSSESRRELRDIQEQFQNTDFNWPYADNSVARAKGQDEVRAAQDRFDAFAIKSPAHASVVSAAWDQATDLIRPPTGYLRESERVTTIEREQTIEASDVIAGERFGMNAYVEAFRVAEADYHKLQLGLAVIEQNIIDDSTVVDPDGFRLAIQDAASTAYTTSRADFDNPAVARDMLRSFVALEGRGAMQEIAQGSLDPLAVYLETPAHQKLAAVELLKSAMSLDVGLESEEIETALEAMDPTYMRRSGIGL